MKKNIKIGNAQAFWGDSQEAAFELVSQQADLDYLTLDYLSEVSLSIMAIQRTKDPEAGYARDFITVLASLVPLWKQGVKTKVIANAGGLDPKKCALACAEALQKLSCPPKRIAVVYGDDVLEILKSQAPDIKFRNLETNEPLTTVLPKLTTANAYLGAKPMVEALQHGADIVITGRVADPSLTVAPCIAEFQWSYNDYHKLAQATLAGHLIECGTQVTGGISDKWLELADQASIGFPFIEMEPNGNFSISKPLHTSGKVSVETVKEQMLYEIGDPHAYLSPDVTLSILSVSLKALPNGVAVTGALGRAPPPDYKVSATYSDGYKAEGFLAIFGQQAKAKAKRCGEIIFERVKKAGHHLDRTLIECLGCGDLVPGISKQANEAVECVLHISAAAYDKEALECFGKQIAPMVTSGPPGTTGYTSGRPHIRPIFGYWPCLIERDKVHPKVEYIQI